MTDFDVTVTWHRADGQKVDLPATVCFRDDRDDADRRAEVVALAFEANTADFPDDLDDGAVPVAVKFSDSSA